MSLYIHDQEDTVIIRVPDFSVGRSIREFKLKRARQNYEKGLTTNKEYRAIVKELFDIRPFEVKIQPEHEDYEDAE